MEYALVAGSTGGLGSHICRELLQSGAQVCPLKSRLDTPGSIRTELSSLKPHPEASRFSLYLFASMASVAACEANPKLAYVINVAGTLEWVEESLKWAERHQRPLSIFFPSTSHVYARVDKGHYIQETAPLGPRSVYGQTKVEAEQRLNALSTMIAPHNITIGRLFGVLGRGQRPYLVLPGLIARVRSEKLDRIPGLHNTRDYMDIRDAAKITLQLTSLKHESRIHTVNICSAKPVTIHQLVNMVIEQTAPTPEVAESLKLAVSPGACSQHDVEWIVGDSRKLLHTLGQAVSMTPLAQSVAEACSEVNSSADL